MNIVFLLLAILAGVFTTFEAGINSQLGKYVTPGIATLHSLIIGTVTVLIINTLMGNLANYTKIRAVSPIWLFGGFFGASIIYLSTRVIPELGISNTVILILSGQLLSSMVVDAVANNIEISLKKLAGVILFLCGAILYLRE